MTFRAKNIKQALDIKMFTSNKKKKKNLLKCTRVCIADLCARVLFVFGKTNVYLFLCCFSPIILKAPGCPHPHNLFRASAFCNLNKIYKVFSLCFFFFFLQ